MSWKVHIKLSSLTQVLSDKGCQRSASAATRAGLLWWRVGGRVRDPAAAGARESIRQREHGRREGKDLGRWVEGGDGSVLDLSPT